MHGLLDLVPKHLLTSDPCQKVASEIALLLWTCVCLSLTVDGQWLWPDLKEEVLSAEGGLLQRLMHLIAEALAAVVGSIEVKVEVTTYQPFLCGLAIVDTIIRRKPDSNTRGRLRAVLIGPVEAVTDHKTFGTIVNFLDLAVREFRELRDGGSRGPSCQRCWQDGGDGGGSSQSAQQRPREGSSSALQWLPWVLEALSLVGKRLGGMTLAESLHSKILGAWPAYKAVLDSSAAAGHGSGMLGLLAPIRMLGHLPQPLRETYWARHWACAIDVLGTLSSMVAHLPDLAAEGGERAAQEVLGVISAALQLAPKTKSLFLMRNKALEVSPLMVEPEMFRHMLRLMGLTQR